MVHYEVLWQWQASVQLQLAMGLGTLTGNGQDFLALEWTTGEVRMCPSARQVCGQLCHPAFLCRVVPGFPFLQKWGSRMLWMLMAKGYEWLSSGLEETRWLLTSARLLKGLKLPWLGQGCGGGCSKAREGDVHPLRATGLTATWVPGAARPCWWESFPA